MMNSLSWLIYLAGVVGTARGWAIAVCAVSGVALGATAFVRLMCGIEDVDFPKDLGPVWKWGIATIIPAALLTAAIPDRTTIYAIAASQAGEQIVNSPTGGKAIKALNAWL